MNRSWGGLPKARNPALAWADIANASVLQHTEKEGDTMHIPTLHVRRLTGLTALACAATLAPAVALTATASSAAATSAATSAAAASAAAARCKTSGLVVWMNTPGSNAAGSVYYTLEFTNLSGHTCTLDGHPGVSAVSLSGRRVGGPAAWAPPAAAKVTLANGATAYDVLQYSNVVISNSGPGPCDPVMAAGLRVYPPDQTASRIVPIPLQACSTGVTYLHVRPIQTDQPPG